MRKEEMERRLVTSNPFPPRAPLFRSLHSTSSPLFPFTLYSLPHAPPSPYFGRQTRSRVSQTLQHIPGTFDVLPDAYAVGGSEIASSAAWQWAEAQVRDVAARFGLEEIRTPILEPTELIARGVGETTDIVQKEMFAFEKGDTRYVLRPEVTAPVMRAYLEHRLDQRGGVQKLFYVGPCFRAERPQKGRFRQFHQFGCEVVGSPDARADAETIAFLMAVCDAFGLTETRLRLNSLGDADARPRYREALRAYFAPYVHDLGETSRARLDTNPLRILDTKDERERRLLEHAPRLTDFLGDDARAHYDLLKGLLADIGIAFVEDPFLVRGLDYYGRTAFELESDSLGAQSALGGGGRYDGLAEELGSRTPVPAVGMAAGLERFFLAMQAAGTPMPGTPPPDVFLVALGDEAQRWAFGAAQQLRASGLRVGFDLRPSSMKAQMREANRSGAPRVVIVGKDELAAEAVQVKDMATGEQIAVPLSDLAGHLGAPLRIDS